MLLVDFGFWLLFNWDSVVICFLVDMFFQFVNVFGGWLVVVFLIDFGGVFYFDWVIFIELVDFVIFSIQVLNFDGMVVIENFYNNFDVGSFESMVIQGQVFVLNLVFLGVVEFIFVFSVFVINWNVMLDDFDLSVVFFCWGMVVVWDQMFFFIICLFNIDVVLVMQMVKQLIGVIIV